MTSLKQIEANRRNALKSTGPVTFEGKQRSRRNAWRHGLTAETVVTNLEDEDDYQAFEEAIIADYDAETAADREFALRLASVLWRLRRANAIEVAMFESAAASNTGAPYPTGLNGERVNEDYDDTKRLFAVFRQINDVPTCPLDRLNRYEHLLWRQARQLASLLELKQRIAKRKPRLHTMRFPNLFERRTLGETAD